MTALTDEPVAPARSAPVISPAPLVPAPDFGPTDRLRGWVATAVVAALAALDQWLDQRGLVLALPDQIGYVSCSAAAAGAGGQLSHLPALVLDMLQTYGCELAVKK